MSPILTFYDGKYTEFSHTKLQEVINRRRMRVMVHMMRHLLQDVAARGADAVYLSGGYAKPSHLYYHKLKYRDGLDLDSYEKRDGWAPSDADRPKYLRGLDLNLDLSLLPDEVVMSLAPGGKFDKLIQQYHIRKEHGKATGQDVADLDVADAATIH